jgi:hypothetical protein
MEPVMTLNEAVVAYIDICLKTLRHKNQGLCLPYSLMRLMLGALIFTEGLRDFWYIDHYINY